MGDLCTKAGERETRQKNVSLPPKAGELASLQISVHVTLHDMKAIHKNWTLNQNKCLYQATCIKVHENKSLLALDFPYICLYNVIFPRTFLQTSV